MSWLGRITDKHIAKKDIKVFKVLYGEEKTWKVLDENYKAVYVPPYYYGAYTLGVLKETIMGIQRFGHLQETCSINQGFHSYSLEKCRWKKNEGETQLRILTKRKDFGSFYLAERVLQTYYLERPSAVFNCKHLTTNTVYAKIMECIIPAGSTYWENSEGQIVSDKIIINKEIKQ